MAALGTAVFFVAALGLLEERGKDAGKSDDEANDEEAEAHGAPERGVAGGAGLLGDVGVGDAAGDEREEDESCWRGCRGCGPWRWIYFTVMLHGERVKRFDITTKGRRSLEDSRCRGSWLLDICLLAGVISKRSTFAAPR